MAVKLEGMFKVGRHKGRINAAKIDSGLNMIHYLMDQSTAMIVIIRMQKITV
jgi:hypothetical protein